MLDLQRILLGIFNVVAMIMGISLAFNIKSSDYKSCDLYSFSLKRIGIMVVIVSMLGICAVILNSKIWRWIYLFFLMILTILIICSSVYISMMLPNISVNEDNNQMWIGYSLKNYPQKLQQVLIGGNEWERLKNCYTRANTCDAIEYYYAHIFEASSHASRGGNDKIKHLQFGCCVIPHYCSSKQKNVTSLVTTQIGTNKDCDKWKRINGGGCFDCDSCKAGYIASLAANIVASEGTKIFCNLIIVLLFAYACYALKDRNEESNQMNYWRGPPQSLPM